jgi:hypothetical protein
MAFYRDQNDDSDLSKSLQPEAVSGVQSGDIAMGTFGDHGCSNALDEPSHAIDFDFEDLFNGFFNGTALDGLDGQCSKPICRDMLSYLRRFYPMWTIFASFWQRRQLSPTTQSITEPTV